MRGRHEKALLRREKGKAAGRCGSFGPERSRTEEYCHSVSFFGIRPIISAARMPMTTPETTPETRSAGR